MKCKTSYNCESKYFKAISPILTTILCPLFGLVSVAVAFNSKDVLCCPFITLISVGDVEADVVEGCIRYQTT